MVADAMPRYWMARARFGLIAQAGRRLPKWKLAAFAASHIGLAHASARRRSGFAFGASIVLLWNDRVTQRLMPAQCCSVRTVLLRYW